MRTNAREEIFEMTAHQTQIRPELLDASDETIEDAVAHGDPAVLRGLLYQLTGDLEIAATRTAAAAGAGFFGGSGAVAEEDVALVRRKAADFLKSYRDSGAAGVDAGPQERLKTAMGLTVGREPQGEEYELWREELALDPWARGLEWRGGPPKNVKDFSVTIIGAGMGGLNAAIQLKHAGIPFTVIEKNAGVGGTWFENRYPGARVDTPSHLYTHIFGVDYSYPNPFCPWTENQKYFDWVADSFSVREDIVFNTEVRSLKWDDAAAMWEIDVSGPEGERTLRSNGVITAVGFLNRPNKADIPGAERFRGRSWHTARWPEDFDPAGKNIAVIGTGCTGYQMVPELALVAEQVTVFQRTPQWIFTAPGYRSPFAPQVNWLDRNLPFHTNFMRLRIASGFGGGLVGIAQIDPNFEDAHSVSPANKTFRDVCIAFLEQKLGDPELVAKMTPPHPVMSARPVLVDPEYSILDAIQRNNVSLVTEPIARITETGIETETGECIDADVIVYATGFHATEYLFPMSITGRGGRTVEALWADEGARGYRGAMIPGFPNLWTLYGPNTNGGLAIPAFQEMETLYALKCIERLLTDSKAAVAVRTEAYDRYNKIVDERNRTMAWSDPRAQNYYWTRFGRSATQNPFGQIEMWNLLRRPDFADLEFRSSSGWGRIPPTP
jgi:4-hydroxyacetophenone monooxygenase